MTEKRPLGVSILASAAFLSSAAWCLLLFFTLVSTLKDIGLGSSRDLYGNALVALVLTSCLLSLAWVSAAAGLDLRKLRSRGRTLTTVSMCMFCLSGIALTVGEPRGILLWAGPSVSALSIGAIVYLFLPNVRRKFEAGAPIAPSAPADSRRVLTVGMASLTSGACMIATALLRLSGGGDAFGGVAILSLFWLPYFFIPFRLRGKKMKSGLTLAIAMATALLLPGVALTYYVHEWNESWWIQGLLLLALVLQPVLAIAALRAYQALPSEPRDRIKAAVSGSYGVLLFGLFWFTAVSGNFPSPSAYDESEAMETMRSVYMSADYYAKSHQGFFPDDSADAGTDEKVECQDDRPGMYHHKEEAGYVIDYHTVRAEKLVAGCRMAGSYTGTARPVNYGKTGRRSFFVDQTGVIRFTSENRAATVGDPKLPVGSLPPL